jgi:Ca2+-binding EF-hand superfamily protein
MASPNKVSQKLAALKTFNPTSRLRQEILKIMVSNIMTEEELNVNKKVFKMIDKDHTGAISKTELCIAMNRELN